MIFCFVVGTDLDSVFRVDGQIKMTIAELKDMIYEKKKNSFEDKSFDSCDLNLWLVDIPYNTENVKLRTLQSRSCDMDKENIIIRELGGKKLSPIDDIGDIFMYDSKNIRIIIQPPPTTGKCLLFFISRTKIISLFCFLYNVLITFISAYFVLDRGLTDVSHYIAEFGYLPRQGTYKLVFINGSVLFLTISLFRWPWWYISTY
jgi:hypothetical protein